MYKVKGKYNEAIVYASNAEALSIQQIETICNMGFSKDSKIRIMPDVHAGAGCTIGTTMTLTNAVIPNMVGVDIGCGMEVIQIEEKEIDLEKLDNLIKTEIPYGRERRKKTHPYAREAYLKELRCIDNIDHLIAESRGIGSLGGGNHFIEVDKDDEGNLYVVIHSGSRHLGKEVAEIYQELSYKQVNGITQEDIQKMINDLKSQRRQKEIQSTLIQMKENKLNDIPKELSYCTGSIFDDYIHDMKIMQHYADLNRKAMMKIIIEGMELHVVEQFTTIHNYIDIDNMILRKGSVSAQKGEKLLIPINMRDGSLICIGKGNPEWNYSAPHGAGRLCSRKEAFRRFTLEEFQEQMKDIYTTTVNKDTLDECPMAYKTIDDIVENIEPTAEIIKIIKPIYNFKAAE